MPRHPFIAILCLLLTLGCEKKDQPAASTPESPTETKPKAAAPTKGETKRGLDDPSNDPAFVSVVKNALKCDWIEGQMPAHDCEGSKKLNESLHGKPSPDEVTLINLIQDQDHRVRIIGADGLMTSGKAFKTDQKTANIVLDAVEREKDKRLATKMGILAGMIQGKETHTTPRLLKIASHPFEQTRIEFINRHFQPPLSPTQWTFLTNRFEVEKGAEIKKALISTMSIGATKEQKTGFCATLWNLFQNKETPSKLKTHTALELASSYQNGNCTEQKEKLLGHIKSMSKSGNVKQEEYSRCLWTMGMAGNPTDDLLAQVRDVAKAMLKNLNNNPTSRADALRTLGATKGGAIKLAKQYKNDKTPHVKAISNMILKGTIKPDEG